jgi:hypothetical protein
VIVQNYWETIDKISIAIQRVASPEGPSSLLYLDPRESRSLPGLWVIYFVQLREMNEMKTATGADPAFPRICFENLIYG